MSFWNLERALQACPNPARPNQGVARAVQQLRCISTDEEIASSVVAEASSRIATALSASLPLASLKAVIQACIEQPSQLQEGVLVALAAHALPRLDKEDLVVVAADAETVDRTLNAPILGATVRELRRDGSKKLQSGLTCGEAAAEIVKEISDGPWDADLTEAVISSGGFLSSASEDAIIEKLVYSVYEHESVDLAVKVAENTALTTRVWWAFVGQLVEKYWSSNRTADLLSSVTKSKSVVIRQLRALRSTSALPVLETFVSLDDSVLVNTCADAVVRMSRALHNAATKRTVHWYTSSQTRYEQFLKWLQSGLGRQLGTLKPSQIKAFLSTVAGKSGGHSVLDHIISSGKIVPSLVFDTLAQALMRPTLSPAVAEGIARRLVDCQAEVSDEKWSSLVVVLPAETPPRLAVLTAATTNQQRRCTAVVERMQQILEGPGGDNLKDRYTAAVAQLAARGLPCDHWRTLVTEDSALAQVVGLSDEVSLARAQGGYPCEDLEGPLIAELNLEVDLEVAGQEWLVDFPPVLPCRDLHDAECSLVELMGAYAAHKLWFARRCLVAASMAASSDSAKGTLIATTTKKKLDVDYSTAVVELLGASFEVEGNDAVWWSTFARLIDCSATVKGNLKVFGEVLEKILPREDTQCPFQAFEKLALEVLMKAENCRKSRAIPHILHTVYHAAMKCGEGEDATWLDERRLFVVRLIRTVSLDLCPEALLLVFESAMLLGTSCQHLRCIADAAAGECWSADGDRHPMSKKVVLWLCDLAEQTEEELAESDTTKSVSTLLDRVAKAIYQVLLQGPFLTSCLSSADGGMLLAVTKPLCRFLDHLVRLNRLENAHSTRIVRMSRCLHDKIDSILRMDGPPSHRAPKLARVSSEQSEAAWRVTIWIFPNAK
ncbi:hypothetical protein FOZ60_013777 [Perkinsus olseni]|uniref:Uncharacterized protein n=1 Tax=Perkinsus olseni TaxID=32597 RepID=A0A7J6N8Q2_PEROL|nr:hypothetical protein FOZ60_013777 [Perkinsus olseni]